jgi:hypothetical protein
MKGHKPVKVIQTKRKPPLWSVKVGARYAGTFTGESGRASAINFAATLSDNFEIIEKPTPRREQVRLDAIAGLSEPI